MAEQRGLEVTFMRGNPMPWPAALGCTVGGALCVVLGYTVVPSFDPPGGDVLTYVIAAVVMVPIVLVAVLVLFADRGGPDTADDVDVPDELDAPPSDDDPAVVAVVVGEGQPSSRAIAGTILDLAAHDSVDISEHGDRVVLSLPSGARPRRETERLVLEDLQSRVDDKGDVVGPPIWSGKAPFWRAYRLDARTRALQAQLVEPRVPFIKLAMVLLIVFSAVALVSFWRILVFIGAILLANGITHLLARAGGYRLTAKGRLERRRWLAFGRYLERQGSLRDVGPAAIAIWGPNLVYGVLVGQADRVAAVLSPEVGRGDDLVVGEVIRKRTL